MANPSIYAAFERLWQQVVALVGSKANVVHSHDDLYYTEAEVDEMVSGLETTDNAASKLAEAKAYAETQASSVVTSAVSGHNTDSTAHSDIRNALAEAQDTANVALPKAGGTMTGVLTLATDPTENLHATTKQYVDTTSIKDWNVNDETNPAYIQNRPFYTTDPQMGTVDNVVINDSDWIETTTSHMFSKETSYTIIYNGTTYENLVPYDSVDEYNDACLCIGANHETLGTDYPFSIEVFPDSGFCWLYYYVSSSGNHTFEIKASQTIDIQLDEKYISYVAGRKVGNEAGEIFNNYIRNIASGIASHAEGDGTTASGYASHAEGISTNAEGQSSHVEGYGTKAIGQNSHAEGWETTSSGYASHAEGFKTTASGYASHAEGDGTTASGSCSHAEGDSTAANDGQHVQGRYNVFDGLEIGDDGSYIKVSDSQYAHIVGNGDYESSRSNAHTLDWDGNAWFAGDVYVGSDSGTNKDTGSKKLATEEYVDNKASVYTYGTADMTAGSSVLETGKLYFVYE